MSEELTKKWKNKELPHGAFYVKICDVVLIDFFDAAKLKFVRFEESAIDEVLALVPSYNKLQELKGYEVLYHRAVGEMYKFRALLKECRPYIKIYTDNKKHFGFTPDSALLLNKIEEVLK